MSEPYLGEIRMFAGNFPPAGWALCNGQSMAISQNEALFALLGTTYGGDGINTFALPDLRGRLPIHQSANYPLASFGGSETVTLTTLQMPNHTHVAYATTEPGSVQSPADGIWAGAPIYSSGKDSDGNPITPVQMNPQAVSATGGSQPHDNMMPSLTLSFIIALQGVIPQSN